MKRVGPHDQPAGAFRGDVEHHQEEPEEQQRGAQVALEDQHAEADQPHRQHRPQVAAAGQVDAEHPSSGQGQRVTVQHEVAGEEEHQQDLGQLTGLEAERAEPDPDPGAVDGGAEHRQQRHHQQHQGRETRGVGEGLQSAVVAHHDQDEDEQDRAQRHPDQLVARERPDRAAGGGVAEVDAVDDRQTEAVEGGDDRQQHRVGVRREDADHDVAAQAQGGQPAAVPDDVGGHGALHAQAHGGVRAHADQQGQQQQEELGAPAAPVGEAPLRHADGRPQRAHEARSTQSGGASVASALGVGSGARPPDPATGHTLTRVVSRLTTSRASASDSAGMPAASCSVG